MKHEFTLRTLGAAIGLALAAPALFAQTPTAAPKPVTAPPAAAKPAAAPVTTPAVAPAKPATTPAAPATGATPATGTAPTGSAAPADPNAPPPAPPPPPLSDIIFTNGDVVTLDDKRPAAQAVAIKGTRIVAVGKAKDILARWKSEGTEVVDLAGKTLVPGFVDAWGQLSRLGLYSVAAPLQPPPGGSVSDINGLVRTLRDWSRGDLAQRFGWIIGYGYDDSRLREQRPLTRQDLDAVSADKPVLVIHHSGRQVVANSRALELAGITRDSVSPPAGSIGRWPGSKEPDGVLDGAAAAALLGALPRLSADDRQALIQQGQTLYLQNGYTTAVEGRATPEDLALYTQAADTGALKLDVMLYADLASASGALKGHKSVGPKYYKNRLRLAGVSFALDGVAEDRSAWLTQPYQLPPPGKRSAYSGYAWASDEAQSWVRASLHILRSWRRQQLDLCHRRLGWTCRASVTPFYLARWGRWDDPAQAQEDPAHPVRLLPELRTLGLKLRDCSSMGLPGWVRVSVQAPPSQQALSQLWRQVIGESSFVPTVRQSGFQSLSTY